MDVRSESRVGQGTDSQLPSGWSWGIGSTVWVKNFLPQGQQAPTNPLFSGSYLHIRGIGCHKSSE